MKQPSAPDSAPLPMRRFFAATDGSPAGEHAAVIARGLADCGGGDFTARTVTHGTNSRHDSVAGTSGLPGVEVVRAAESWGADLLVLGRKVCSPEWPQTLGSTSDMVLRRHAGPCLSVPLGCTLPRHAAIALDGSPRGLGAIVPAFHLLNVSRATGAAICILPNTEVFETDAEPWLDPRCGRVREAIAGLSLTSGPCELLVRWGGPVAEILDLIRTLRIDLLVIGIRRGGQSGESGSGYVGRELLRSAPCAVLTVPI